MINIRNRGWMPSWGVPLWNVSTTFVAHQRSTGEEIAETISITLLAIAVIVAMTYVFTRRP